MKVVQLSQYVQSTEYVIQPLTVNTNGNPLQLPKKVAPKVSGPGSGLALKVYEPAPIPVEKVLSPTRTGVSSGDGIPLSESQQEENMVSDILDPK